MRASCARLVSISSAMRALESFCSTIACCSCKAITRLIARAVTSSRMPSSSRKSSRDVRPSYERILSVSDTLMLLLSKFLLPLPCQIQIGLGQLRALLEKSVHHQQNLPRPIEKENEPELTSRRQRRSDLVKPIAEGAAERRSHREAELDRLQILADDLLFFGRKR